LRLRSARSEGLGEIAGEKRAEVEKPQLMAIPVIVGALRDRMRPAALWSRGRRTQSSGVSPSRRPSQGVRRARERPSPRWE